MSYIRTMPRRFFEDTPSEHASSEEALPGEDAGEASVAPLHVSRVAVWVRQGIIAGWMLLLACFTYGEYYNTLPYHEISWSLLFIGCILISTGFGFVIWYQNHTYRITVYPDRIEQRSYLWPGIENPAPSWQGRCTLYYKDLGRVRIPGSINSAINFYRLGATNAALYTPYGVTDRTGFVRAVLETLPDHVEITGKDKIISYYRGERELAWWEW